MSLRGEHIGVVIRLRPLSQHERLLGAKRAVGVDEDGSLRVEGFEAIRDFDKCFDERTAQQKFFDECGMPRLLDSVSIGFRGTAFAYGQTGSGKSYTMMGSTGDDGLVSQSMRYIFDRAPSRRVRVTCLEIYRGLTNDLLDPGTTPLLVREHPKLGFFVEGLCATTCDSLRAASRTIADAFSIRRNKAHRLNHCSSRSHCLLTVYVEDVHAKSFGSISFVDLAGSERLKETGSSDAGYINASLYVLGKVIRSLQDNRAYVPYRESQLTKLLISSLGGNCKCLMFGCCSTADIALAETLRTLEFAKSIRRIKSFHAVQRDPNKNLVSRLRSEIERLKHENAQIKAQLRATQPLTHSASDIFTSSSTSLRTDVPSIRAPQQATEACVVDGQLYAGGSSCTSPLLSSTDCTERSLQCRRRRAPERRVSGRFKRRLLLRTPSKLIQADRAVRANRSTTHGDDGEARLHAVLARALAPYREVHHP